MSLAHTIIDRRDFEAIKKCLECACTDKSIGQLEEGLRWLGDPDTQAHLRMILDSFELSGDLIKSITIEDNEPHVKS